MNYKIAFFVAAAAAAFFAHRALTIARETAVEGNAYTKY
jgi:hypothetical protein